MRRIHFPTALICLFFAAVVAGDVTWDSEFGNTLYNTPKGWSTTQKTGSVLLIPPDLKDGEQAAIVITPGGDLTGDFKDAFNDIRAQLRGDAKANESKVESTTAEEGYPVLYVAEQLQGDKEGAQQYRYYFGSHPGNRAEFVILVANTTDAYERYAKVFGEFVKTLAYKNARPGAHATSAPTTQQ